MGDIWETFLKVVLGLGFFLVGITLVAAMWAMFGGLVWLIFKAVFL